MKKKIIKKANPKAKARAGKVVKKIIKKSSAKKVVANPAKARAGKALVKKISGVDRKKEQEVKTSRLLAKGRERGFVTYDEILKEFPNIEMDVMFLDEL